jgi:Flp pilus assembly protein TadD
MLQQREDGVVRRANRKRRQERPAGAAGERADAMKRYAVGLSLAAVFVLAACATLPGSAASGVAAGIFARGAIGRVLTVPLYEGDGGAGIRLVVLPPEAQGEVPVYLPLYIQGLLNSNFRRYSALTLVDRQDLEKIIAERDLAAGGGFSDADLVHIGDLTGAQYILFGTIQRLSGGKYALRLSITGPAGGKRQAAFSGNGKLARIEGNGALINEASADLLSQLGVRLTEAGRAGLLGGNVFHAQAESALARGAAAESAGSQVEALFNFSRAASLDPSMPEALSRLQQVSASISGGSVSKRIVSDIQARDRWLEAMRETARFFDGRPPFEIIFDPSLTQESANYARRTATLGMHVALDTSEAGFAALNVMLEGLESTGRRGAWGFAPWPFLDVQPPAAGTKLFNGKRDFTVTLEALLLNEQGRRVGKGSVTLKSGEIPFRAGDKRIVPPASRFGMLRFTKVKADDLTPALTIVINSVNRIPFRTLSNTGYMRIAAGAVAERAKRTRQLDADPEIVRYTQAITKNPDDGAAYKSRGFAYYNKQDYDKAIVDYTQALRIDPNDAAVYYFRGFAYYSKQDYDRAIADYTQALRIDPDYVDAYSNRGFVYYRKQDYDRAIADYTQALRVDPDYADAYYNRGNAYSGKDDYDKAIADYTQSLRINPEDAFARKNRGFAYHRKQD